MSFYSVLRKIAKNETIIEKYHQSRIQNLLQLQKLIYDKLTVEDIFILTKNLQ